MFHQKSQLIVSGVQLFARYQVSQLILTLTWPMCQIWHIHFLQILNALADCMVKQTLE